MIRHTTQKLADVKLRSGLERTEKKFEDAAHSTAVAELLLPEEAGFLEAEGMEETFKFDQNQLKVWTVCDNPDDDGSGDLVLCTARINLAAAKKHVRPAVDKHVLSLSCSSWVCM